MLKRLLIGGILIFIGALAGGLAIMLLRSEPTAQIIQVQKPSTILSQPTLGTTDFTAIVNSVTPAVVNISATKILIKSRQYQDDAFLDFFKDFFNPLYDNRLQKKQKQRNVGSGVIVADNGFILTNYHVIENAERIIVTLFDKRAFEAMVVGADPKTDLAVLRIEAKDLPSVKWGDSDDISVGEFVLAFGNPFGLSHTVTMGIISAKGRANVGVADYEDFIQTDAAINPGNSGGPLVGTNGSLIGINTAIFSKSGGYQGIGFAVPSNMARLVMEQLIKRGKIIRGWLGVSLQELTPELSKAFGHNKNSGALVSEIMDNSPAIPAGIAGGDIILEFSGKETLSPAMLRNMVAMSKPGQKVKIKILRNKATRIIDIVVGQLPTEDVASHPEPEADSTIDVFTGLNVIELTHDLAKQLNLSSDETGVIVVGVQDGSAASEAGVKRGDVIHKINNKQIQSLADFNRASADVHPDDIILMYMSREGKKFFITVLLS